jgi:hypothetical protein
VFTVTSLVGPGSFFACFSGLAGGGGSAFISFGQARYVVPANDGTSLCLRAGSFTSGVPQTIGGSATALASSQGHGSGSGYVVLKGFDFFNETGGHLSDVAFKLTSTTVPESPFPEPSTFSLLIPGLLAWIAMLLWRRPTTRRP